MDDFDINKWKKEINNDSLFPIDPSLAHKIWDLIIKELKWTYDLQDGEVKFSSGFPTASSFENFLNKKLKQ